MKQADEIVIKQSPFIFIKYLVVIEFFFAFIPIIAIWLLDAARTYESVDLAQSLPFGWLIAILMTSLQVFILIIAFVVWYFPSYHVNNQEIIYKRGGLYQDTSLLELSDVSGIHIQQGWFGKRFNYGDLLLERHRRDDRAKLRNIPNPDGVLTQIKGIIASQPLTQSMDNRQYANSQLSLPKLIVGGENQNVEFKASLVWDYRQEKANKELYTPVMKNSVAFLNSGGGDVLIGIGDDGELLGIEPDLNTMQKRNTDGFENIFNMAFNKMVGVEYRQYVTVTFPKIDGVMICRLSVSPSNEPAYLQYRGDERFYIRAGNASQPLTVSKATNYIRSHFET
jgi:membrane protein YdbS with pleckstrin-like domain